jgi:hypothetical protein
LFSTFALWPLLATLALQSAITHGTFRTLLSGRTYFATFTTFALWPLLARFTFQTLRASNTINTLFTNRTLFATLALRTLLALQSALALWPYLATFAGHALLTRIAFLWPLFLQLGNALL